MLKKQLPEELLLAPAFQPSSEYRSDSLLGLSSGSNVVDDDRHQLLRFDLDDSGKDTTQLLKIAHFKTVFAAMCFSEFIRAIDSVVLPVILPGIVRELSASSSEGYLSGSAFLLFQTISQPLYKGLAEAFGDKPCLLVALTTFAAASVLSGVAKNPEWLIAGRSVRHPLHEAERYSTDSIYTVAGRWSGRNGHHVQHNDVEDGTLERKRQVRGVSTAFWSSRPGRRYASCFNPGIKALLEMVSLTLIDTT